MQARFRRLTSVYKAWRQLGPQAVLLYAWYQLNLHTGLLRRQTPARPLSERPTARPIQPVLPPPDRVALAALLGEAGLAALTAAADEIVAGKVRLFGGDPVPLELAPPGPLRHWTDYERGRAAWGVDDVKLLWEPARFEWAYTLSRAYFLTRNEAYPQAFWEHTETFLTANPTHLGPNWASSQEVALRLIAWAFAAPLLAASSHSTPARQSRLAEALAAHAARIPGSLAYARAQNNNHLLLEAAGLYTAALALPNHPQAPVWKRTGWRWLNAGFQSQIAPDGAYMQNSTNYHRLMLQAALWMYSLKTHFPGPTRRRLEAAVGWLAALIDPLSGEVPNLGPNDGAYIQPLTVCPFSDYRPVLQAASRAFLGTPACAPGIWDETSLWLDLPNPSSPPAGPPAHPKPTSPLVLRGPHSWAYLRAARFTSRPGHADQLHFDLWWQGLNLAQDPGTYFYNAPPPWENALTRTAVHNTLTLNGKDQMTYAGRFLWLDWAQAQVDSYTRSPDMATERASAHHNGYRKLGLTHRRTVEHHGDEWTVQDEVTGPAASTAACLHWLLPDLPWSLEESAHAQKCALRLQTPAGPVLLAVLVAGNGEGVVCAPQIVRAGQVLYGSPESSSDPNLQTRGWVSRTYAHKQPALSLSIQISAPLPLTIISRWQLGAPSNP